MLILKIVGSGYLLLVLGLPFPVVLIILFIAYFREITAYGSNPTTPLKSQPRPPLQPTL